MIKTGKWLMKVGESSPQAWELEGTRRTNWETARADPVMAPQTVSEEERARHMSNLGVTWLQEEPDMCTRDQQS